MDEYKTQSIMYISKGLSHKSMRVTFSNFTVVLDVLVYWLDSDLNKSSNQVKLSSYSFLNLSPPKTTHFQDFFKTPPYKLYLFSLKKRKPSHYFCLPHFI